MGISVADNFKHLSKKFLDDRESFDTLADMKAVSDSDIPEGFETYCKATDKRYKFLSANTVDSTTGKWREVEYGGGGTSDYTDLQNKPSIEGITLSGNKTASDLGLAKANQIPTVPTKVSQLQNDSGFITSSALPGVYEGDTAGLVPSAGSDNEGKYLDNDGNWTTVPMPMIGTINRSDIYDTTEKVIGKWTDGRPVYQKTIVCSGLPNNTTKGFAHSISNISSIIDVHGIAYAASNPSDFFPLPYVGEISGTNYQGKVYANKTNVVIHTFTDWSTYNASVTLYYTKTTDSANSYNYADENDYSTSEKIIGKWIGEKTLYQKTVNFGALPNNTAKTVAHGISSLGEIIDITGSSYVLGGAYHDIKYYIDIPNYNPVINISVDSTNIYVTTESDLSSSTAYVTLKYTKS